MQTPVHAYDRIERPEIKPDVTRVTLYGGLCPCCAERFTAAPPPGLEPGSPFEPNLRALAIYLRFEPGDLVRATVAADVRSAWARDQRGSPGQYPRRQQVHLCTSDGLRAYRYKLDASLDALLRIAPTHAAGEKLQDAIKGCRRYLFVFLANRAIPPTNNGSEQRCAPASSFEK